MSKIISVIGGGLIGQQWAMLFSAYKINVIIYEPMDEQLNNAKLAIEESLKQYFDKKISRSNEDFDMQLKRIKLTNNYGNLPKESEFVIECIPENIELKHEAFQLMDRYFSKDTIRMSSSSYIPISKFTSDLIHRSKCIITHPVNPPYFLRLVEIVPASYTDNDTISRTKTLMEDIQQKPVIFKKEIDGFGLNRIQGAVFNSIFKLINDDAISVSDIDTLMTEGLGPRWAFYGPIKVASLNGPGIENYCKKYLAGIDLINIEQNYLPQYNDKVIERLIKNDNFVDMQDLKSVYEDRNFKIGQILKMKMDSIN